jgi:hypothetical protein
MTIFNINEGNTQCLSLDIIRYFSNNCRKKEKYQYKILYQLTSLHLLYLSDNCNYFIQNPKSITLLKKMCIFHTHYQYLNSCSSKRRQLLYNHFIKNYVQVLNFVTLHFYAMIPTHPARSG